MVSGCDGVVPTPPQPDVRLPRGSHALLDGSARHRTPCPLQSDRQRRDRRQPGVAENQIAMPNPGVRMIDRPTNKERDKGGFAGFAEIRGRKGSPNTADRDQLAHPDTRRKS